MVIRTNDFDDKTLLGTWGEMAQLKVSHIQTPTL